MRLKLEEHLDNYQFLKDVFEAAIMTNVDYLVIAIRESYRGRNDYVKIYEWLEPFLVSLVFVFKPFSRRIQFHLKIECVQGIKR